MDEEELNKRAKIILKGNSKDFLFDSLVLDSIIAGIKFSPSEIIIETTFCDRDVLWHYIKFPNWKAEEIKIKLEDIKNGC